MELTLLIPAWNEAGNLAVLIPRLRQVVDRLAIRHEILVVDGGSVDDTVGAAERLGARVIRQQEPGYGGALRAGFTEAKGQYIATMDADFSHRPEFLRRLWNVRHQAEVVIASRYVPGGRADMPLSRYLLSRVLNAFFARGLSLPYRDLSSGFRLYRRAALEQVQIESRDFEVLEEILIRLHAQGFQIREVPFSYAPRREGRSHAKVLKFGLRMLRTFFRMWGLRNSIECCDYDWRAYDSLIWPQRYWQRRRFDILAELSASASRTLDVGCGSGRVLLSLPDAVGVDLRLNKLRYLRRHGQPGLVGDLFALPILSGSFDCVVCSEVIEHVSSDHAWLEELIRVLTPDGLLIIGTPDYGGWRWPFIEWVYGKVMPGGYAHEHITHYTRASLTELLARYGFEPVAYRSIVEAEMVLSFRRRQ